MMKFEFTMQECSNLLIALEVRQLSLIEFMKKFVEDTTLLKMYRNEFIVNEKLINQIKNYKF